MKKTLMKVMGMVFAVLAVVSCSKSDSGSDSVADPIMPNSPLGGSSKATSALVQGSVVNGNILGRIPADADFAAVVDFKTFLNSADIQLANGRLTIPSYLFQMIPELSASDVDQVNQMIATVGIDPSGIGVFGSYNDIDDESFIILAHLLEPAKAVDFFKNQMFGNCHESSRGDLTVLSSTQYGKSSCVVVDGEWAYAIIDSYRSNVEGKICESIAKAGKDSYGELPVGQYLAQSNVGGAAAKIPAELAAEARREGVPANICELLQGYVCAKGALTSDEAIAELRWINSKGVPVSLNDVIPGISFNKPVNQKMLELLGSDTNFAMAVNLGDINWEKLGNWLQENGVMSRSDAAQFKMVSGYLNDLEGTIVFGAGIKNGLSSISACSSGNPQDVLSNVQITAAVEIKNGKAAEYLDNLISMTEMAGMSCDRTSNGYRIGINAGYVRFPLYASVVGNAFVVSTEAINGARPNAISTGVNFSGAAGGIAFAFPKNDPLMRDLGFDCGLFGALCLDPAHSLVVAAVKTEGSSDNFLTTLFKNCYNVAKNSNRIERMVSGSSYAYADDYYYDDMDWDYDGYEAVAEDYSSWADSIAK